METKDYTEKINKNYLPSSIMLRERTIGLLNTLKEYSLWTYEHSIDVANTAISIAKHLYANKTLKLTQEQVSELYTSALLHDIGKLHISKDILNHKGPLSLEEKRTMRGHVKETQEILKDNGFPKEIIEVACSHHQRLNGSGYGTVATRPEDARTINKNPLKQILATADVWDAMRENRPYKKALDDNKAIEEIYEMVKNHELDATPVNAVVTLQGKTNNHGRVA